MGTSAAAKRLYCWEMYEHACACKHEINATEVGVILYVGPTYTYMYMLHHLLVLLSIVSASMHVYISMCVITICTTTIVSQCCMHVCVCVYMYVCIRMSIYPYMHTYTHTHRYNMQVVA